MGSFIICSFRQTLLWNIKSKYDETGEACSNYRKCEKCLQNFCRASWRKYTTPDLVTGILKCIWTRVYRVYIGFIWLLWGTGDGLSRKQTMKFSSTNGWMFPTPALHLSPSYRKFYTVSGTLYLVKVFKTIFFAWISLEILILRKYEKWRFFLVLHTTWPSC